MEKEIVDIFTDALYPLGKFTNGSDWALGTELSGQRKRQLREGFQIDNDEEIIYCRDTSFWNSGDQGIVFTDKYFRFLYDNDRKNSVLCVSWQDLAKAEYKDDAILLYDGDEPVDFKLDYFVKEGNSQRRNRCGKIIAEAIDLVINSLREETEEFASNVREVFEEFIDQYKYLHDNSRDAEAAALAYDYYSKCNHPDILFYGLAAEPDSEKCLKILDKEWEYWNQLDSTRYIMKALYSHNLLASGRIKAARKFALNTYNELPSDFEWIDGNQKDSMREVFEKSNDAYVANFFDMPYQERKLLMPVRRYTELDQEFIAVLDFNHLEHVKFPIGHPIANNLYVAHPLLQDYYVPFESYEIEFVKDRVHEFCHLMQSLGATSISIEYHQASKTDYESDRDEDYSAKASIKGYSAKGGVHEAKKNSFMEQIAQELSLKQHFNPSETPSVPDNLVWYPQEASWQRIVQQRLQGSLTSHTEKIVTSKTQVINNESLTDIKAELDVLLASADLKVSVKTSEKFKQHESVVLNIHVEFAPIEQLDNATPERKVKKGFWSKLGF